MVRVTHVVSRADFLLSSLFSRKIDDVRLGLGNSSAVGPQMVGAIVTAFLDALYKA